MNSNKKTCALSMQFGLGLVELMISVFLGSFIMAGVLQLFLSSNRTSNTAVAISRLQENIRYAVTRLGNDIARAGNMGCLSLSAAGSPSILHSEARANGSPVIQQYVYNRIEGSPVTITDGNNVVMPNRDLRWDDFESSFISGNNDSLADFVVSNSDVILEGTDTIIVKYVDIESGIEIIHTPAWEAKDMTLDNIKLNASQLVDNDIVFAGNCEGIYVFNVVDVDDHKDGDLDNNDNRISMAFGFHNINVNRSLSFLYSGDSGAYEYYISASSSSGAVCSSMGVNRQNCSLYRLKNGKEREELVTGVHGFQVRYGNEGAPFEDTIESIGRLTVDRVEITLNFNVVDTTQDRGLLTRDITRVFAVRNQLKP